MSIRLNRALQYAIIGFLIGIVLSCVWIEILTDYGYMDWLGVIPEGTLKLQRNLNYNAAHFDMVWKVYYLYTLFITSCSGVIGFVIGFVKSNSLLKKVNGRLMLRITLVVCVLAYFFLVASAGDNFSV